MAKQRHDIGWKKRNRPDLPQSAENTNALARELVERGLATSQILDVRYRPEGRKDRP